MAAKIVLNSEGIEKMLRCQDEFEPILDDLERRGKAAAEQAGPGMEVERFVGEHRARVTVITGTTEARLAEAQDRVLTAALDAARA